MVEFASMAICTFNPARQRNQPAGAEWRSILTEAVRCPAELCRLLGLPPALAEEAERSAQGFPLLAPRTFLARIRPGDPADPLLLQVLPRAAENAATPGFLADPLGEVDACDRNGLLRKYQGRVLIVATGSCGVHCRFCFRRHFPYDQGRVTPSSDTNGAKISDSHARCNGGAIDEREEPSEATLDKIAADPTIHEVILSGGDPLMLPDERLDRLVRKFSQIPHLRRLRIHSRLPVIIPQRITDGLISALRGGRLAPVMVVHVNHPAEIDADVAEGLGRLVDAGIPVLSQSVLLRGVNDRIETLVALYERLVDLRVMPYYLHQLDRVAGAAHFEVPVSTGVELVSLLRVRLPGYAVPRYVRETRGGANKEPLA